MKQQVVEALSDEVCNAEPGDILKNTGLSVLYDKDVLFYVYLMKFSNARQCSSLSLNLPVLQQIQPDRCGGPGFLCCNSNFCLLVSSKTAYM